MRQRNRREGGSRLLFGVMVVVSASCASVVEASELHQPYKPPRDVQVIAHRGVAFAAPENTRPALELAVEIGCEWVEIDVRLTRDGHHVILHDSALERTTDGKGKITDHTLEQIRDLDAGSWFAPRFAGQRVPTLPQVLAWAKGKINLYLDCKGVNLERLVKEVLDAEMEDQAVVFDSKKDADTIHRLSQGRVRTMPNYVKNLPLDAWFRPSAPTALEVDHDLLSPDLVARCRSEGVCIQTDALGVLLDNPAGWRKIIDRGANWIQSDRPDALLAAFYKQGAYKRKDRPILGDHRGAKQLAPENTLAAFKKSIELGMDMTEIDVRTSSDGKLVVIHDPTLDRTTDGTGAVQAHTLEELRKLSAGRWFAPRYTLERIPTFREVLELCKDRIRVKVDVKQADPKQLADEIRACGMAKQVIVLDTPPYLKQLAEYAPEIPCKTWFRKDKYLDSILETIQPEALEISWGRCTPERVALIHKHGIKAFTCTPHHALPMRAYTKMMETGVDIIQTDHPVLLGRAVEIFLKTRDDK